MLYIDERFIYTPKRFLKKFYDRNVHMKLTEEQLGEYITSEGLPPLVRAHVKLENIQMDQLLKGEYILIKCRSKKGGSKKGRVVPYYSPYMQVQHLEREMRGKKKKDLEKIRDELLGSLGYEYDVRGMVQEKLADGTFAYYEEEVTYKKGRGKRKVFQRKTKMCVKGRNKI